MGNWWITCCGSWNKCRTYDSVASSHHVTELCFYSGRGYMEAADMTNMLRSHSYWASYNIPCVWYWYPSLNSSTNLFSLLFPLLSSPLTILGTSTMSLSWVALKHWSRSMVIGSHGKDALGLKYSTETTPMSRTYRLSLTSCSMLKYIVSRA